MRTSFWLCLLAAACGSLRENSLAGVGDAGVSDAGVLDGDASRDTLPDGSTASDAGSDAALAPLREDIACAGTNGWDQTQRTAECESRQLRVVQSKPADALRVYDGLELAWSQASRVGIVLAWQSGTGSDVDSGYLQALTFDTASPTFTVRPDRVLPAMQFQFEGAGARIVARADGSFEVLSLLNEQGYGGDVLIRSLPLNQPFSPPVVVFGGAYRNAQLGLLTHQDGRITATASVGDETGLQIVTRQRQPGATAFGALFVAKPVYYPPGPARNGNHRMTLDSHGAAHLAVEQGGPFARSQPRYAQLTTTGWEKDRTLDNAGRLSIAGEDISIMVVGDDKNVIYVTEARTAADEVLPYARIVRARWRGFSDSIAKTVLVDELPLDVNSELSRLGTVRAAAAADASGAIHVVYSRRRDADAGDGICEVKYLREVATTSGGRDWMQDDVAGMLACDDQAPAVALAVEPGGRPHIGYVDAAQGVVYATRYDR